MRLFLTHVDTPYRIYHEGLPFDDCRLMLSASDLNAFDEVHAVTAFWCDKRLTDEEGWRENRRMRAHAKGIFPFSHISAVEDARILADSPLVRLSELYDDGVRVIAPFWQGVNRFGGAHDTDIGLSSYGRHVLSSAMEMGMVIDLSHASDRSARDILCLARTFHAPVMASHSNFRSVASHTRNLPDDIAVGIAESGGVIGLCLVPAHVGMTRDIPALQAHIAHARSIGIHAALCIGSDFDGTDTLIPPMTSCKHLFLLADAMRTAGDEDSLIDHLFYQTAQNFFARCFPCLL